MLVVQKYGGSSVATLERIRAVAQRVLDRQRSGDQVVVVVSAMAGETNRLIDVANQLHRIGHEQAMAGVARGTGWSPRSSATTPSSSASSASWSAPVRSCRLPWSRWRSRISAVERSRPSVTSSA